MTLVDTNIECCLSVPLKKFFVFKCFKLKDRANITLGEEHLLQIACDTKSVHAAILL